MLYFTIENARGPKVTHLRQVICLRLLFLHMHVWTVSVMLNKSSWPWPLGINIGDPLAIDVISVASTVKTSWASLCGACAAAVVAAAAVVTGASWRRHWLGFPLRKPRAVVIASTSICWSLEVVEAAIAFALVAEPIWACRVKVCLNYLKKIPHVNSFLFYPWDFNWWKRSEPAWLGHQIWRPGTKRMSLSCRHGTVKFKDGLSTRDECGCVGRKCRHTRGTHLDRNLCFGCEAKHGNQQPQWITQGCASQTAPPTCSNSSRTS